MDALEMGLKASVNAAKEVVKAFDNGLLGVKRFNFKSQICTTREQSERLLSLGLKKETADMSIGHTGLLYPYPHREEEDRVFIPAWSLHRLMILAATPLELDEMLGYNIYDYYDNAINHIESLIKEGYFPKEYLEE